MEAVDNFLSHGTYPVWTLGPILYAPGTYPVWRRLEKPCVNKGLRLFFGS